MELLAERSVLAICSGDLFWRSVLAICSGDLFWRSGGKMATS
jgi:hypothetical protein